VLSIESRSTDGGAARLGTDKGDESCCGRRERGRRLVSGLLAGAKCVAYAGAEPGLAALPGGRGVLDGMTRIDIGTGPLRPRGVGMRPPKLGRAIGAGIDSDKVGRPPLTGRRGAEVGVLDKMESSCVSFP
jgi:hypothetical protein